MAMEYVEGAALRTLIEGGPLRPERAVTLCEQVLGALAEAHDAGIVHRDVKPDNVMVWTDPDGNERAKVLDFGIAKILRTETATDSMGTPQGATVGTPAYLAPEQALSGEVDGRSDQYAVGVMLYEMLTGRRPFTGSPLQLVMAHTSREVPAFRPELELSPALERATLRALEKDPDARYTDARAMARALRAALAGEAPEPAAAGGELDTTLPPPSVEPEPATGTLPVAGEAAAASPEPPGPGGRLPLLVGVALGALGAAWWVLAPSPAPEPPADRAPAASTTTASAVTPVDAAPPPIDSAPRAPDAAPPPDAGPAHARAPDAAPAPEVAKPRPSAPRPKPVATPAPQPQPPAPERPAAKVRVENF